MAEVEKTTVQGTPRWVRILLGVSLALNLLIVGLVGGAMISHTGRPDGGYPREVGFGPFTEALSRRDKAALRRAFIERGGGFAANRDVQRQEMAELLAALRKTPFDPDPVRGILEGQVLRGQGRAELGRQLLLERIEAMSPSERADFADGLEQAVSRRRARSAP